MLPCRSRTEIAEVVAFPFQLGFAMVLMEVVAIESVLSLANAMRERLWKSRGRSRIRSSTSELGVVASRPCGRCQVL